MMETLVIQSQSRRVETASGGHDQFYIDVYDLKTGELVEVPEHIKDVTNYMK